MLLKLAATITASGRETRRCRDQGPIARGASGSARLAPHQSSASAATLRKLLPLRPDGSPPAVLSLAWTSRWRPKRLGGHARLPPAQLEDLLAGIGNAIDAAGGSFTMRYTTVAATAAR